MLSNTTEHNTPVALITGGARRIGAEIIRQLHQQNYRVLIHYRHSQDEAQQLADSLNQLRANSVALVQADLGRDEEVEALARTAPEVFGRVDVLVNNASSFYPTPVGTATPKQWDELMSSNAKAPFFLSQALAPELKQRTGCIINIADIHASKPLKEYTLYCMAKAANVMLTQSLARELAPHVRVNSVAPGAILWPEDKSELDASGKQSILERIPLGRNGAPRNIAQAVLYLLQNDYVTGQVLPVDGGRSIN
ncbi:pteridine reductase [Aestuariicella sp. G3-2]|uniref:pteridine reductase n=1 Tax=Pseudomaricurvus albidus TaxID=2842452 RepID=UPI001C0B71E7|nr:pteridine reductase [Aestuariicella albida]MBU3070590.1 pteridine reductase [Aestuariicella albida]